MANQDQTQPLRLFSVTLPWNPSNSEEGDYGDTVWAGSHDEAIRAIASDMADHHDSGVDEGDEKAKARYIDILIENAGQFAAEDLGAGLVNRVSEYMAGPSGTMTDEAQKDFETVKAILARYGAFAG